MRKLFVLLLVPILGLITGCAPSKPATLTVYTYSSFPTSLVKQIQKDFKTNYKTDVVVKTFGDTGPIFNRLVQEKRHPKADVVIGLDSNYAFRAKKAGLFQAYKPKQAANLRHDVVFDPQFYLTPYDYGYIVFNYDSKNVKRVPTSHKDLLSPIYKDQIVVENPTTSSPGQIFLLTTIALYGEKGYLDYWKGLKKNGLFIAPGWDEAYGMYTNGERSIVLSYATSPVYHLLYEKTERYKAVILDGAAYAQIEGVGVVKDTPHLQLAQKLVDYMLSKTFQEKLPETQFMYPALQSAKLPPSYRVAPKTDRLLNLPAKRVADNLERWLGDWEKAMNE
ncbi:MAG TPA: thiamine ABC transporter substrate-binding protein [Bacillota bacterium]|nr:thiamine ABC transporter substrate-binding protein [Bacillota bacterium]